MKKLSNDHWSKMTILGDKTLILDRALETPLNREDMGGRVFFILPSLKLTFSPMKIPMFPGKYHQNGGFSMAMLGFSWSVIKNELTCQSNTASWHPGSHRSCGFGMTGAQKQYY